MKKLNLIVIVLLLPISGLIAASDELPYEAKQLIQKRDAAFAKINKGLKRELYKLKIKLMKRGDLNAANMVNNLLNEKFISPKRSEYFNRLTEKLIGSKWVYHHPGVNIPIEFNENGSLAASGPWKKIRATWRAISDNEIILEHSNGNKSVMTFNKSLNTFRGIDWDGSKVVGSKKSQQ